MARVQTITQAELNRALKAATDAGLTVHEIVMEPRRVRVLFHDSEAPAPANDEVLPKPWPTAG